MPRTTKTHRKSICSLLGTALIAGVVCSAMLAGCGGGDDEETASAEGFESAYCATARSWAAHELNGGGDGAFAHGGPAALERWWNEQLAYLKVSLQQAPPVIHEAEATFERTIRTRLTPVLTKYGFDPKRLEAEGSPSEQALVAEQPPDAAKADEARRVYQDRVCGYGGEPPAADVTFKASPSARPYCKAVAAQLKGNEEVESSGFDPEALQAYVTSDGLLDALDAQDATAPSEIAADVKADNDWARTRVLEVLEEFDYDVRRILRAGSAQDLAVYTSWDPAIREQGRRVTAYQEQVCA
jgi:hypothetical protein